MYNHIVGAFTDEKQDLIQQNSKLRHTLKNLNDEVNQLRNFVYSKISKATNQEEDLKNEIFDLPYNLMGDVVEGSIRRKMDDIKMQVEKITNLEKGILSIYANINKFR